ncbi:MAG: low specificity L-threonine aldolase, partial [Lachnospiraceae bacterium]|nr:low specificity L-threonine aldolase [Lachnospiraceae bacterium]
MVYFGSDYLAGAHPAVLKHLSETNLECLSGYGSDKYCDMAKEKIRRTVGLPEAQVEFIAGGTQTNAVVVSTMLRDHEGVIAAKTGHIAAHEAGSIEYTGHKVMEVPQYNGKLKAADVKALCEAFY